MDLIDRIEIIDRKLINDNRGYFLKILTGKENKLPSYTGEIYLTYAIAESSRGGHYHKKATEWFTIIQGRASLKLIDVETEESICIALDGSIPKTIVVPPYVAHLFENEHEEHFLLHAYTDILYNPEDTVNYKFPE